LVPQAEQDLPFRNLSLTDGQRDDLWISFQI